MALALSNAPFGAAEVRRHLVGVSPWLDAAALSDPSYNDSHISNVLVPAAIRDFERDTRFRVNQVQIVSNADGTFDDGHGNDRITGAPAVVESPYDFYHSDASNFFSVLLRERPVQMAQRYRIMIGTAVIYTAPAEWFNVDRRTGRLHLLPYSLSGFISGTSLALSQLYLSYGDKGYIPNVVAVDYIAGLAPGWQLSPEWSDLKRALEQWCAWYVLQDISQVFDPGVMNKSLSIEGENLSVNYDRFERRKSELLESATRFQATMKDTQTPVVLGVV